MSALACVCCENPIADLKTAYGSIYEPICLDCDIELTHKSLLPVYGRFIGGDPRKFEPDKELCLPEEIALWESDCLRWNNGDFLNRPVTGYQTINGNLCHVHYANYGIGVNNG